MAESLPPLAQSESKSRFMERLGLDVRRPEHKAIYGLMKAEATKERAAMLSDRSVLLPNLRDDMTIQAPFSSSQITAQAMRAAIQSLYEHASPQTKVFYARSQDDSNIDPNTGLPITDNWIIRWLLWHVFRYRDSRNRHPSTIIAIDVALQPLSQVMTDTMISNDSHRSKPMPPKNEEYGVRHENRLPPLHSSVFGPEDPTILHNPLPPSLRTRLPYDPTRDG